MTTPGINVTGITTQTNCFNSRTTQCGIQDRCAPGEILCDRILCGGGLFGHMSVCGQIDPSVCPNIAGGAVNVAFAQATATHSLPEQIACTYNVNNFTAGDVDIWINTFGMGNPNDPNDPLNKVIFPTFCAKSSSSCPIDSTTGNPMPMCANLSATDEAGMLCRRWASLRANQDIADSTKKTACLLNNTPDCACINRAQNKAYRIIKQGNPFKDGCWFIPCSNPDVFLIPSDDMIRPGDCPQTVCQVVNEIVAESGGTVVIGGQTNDISCSLGGGGGNPANLRWWIIAIIIVVVIIVLIVISSRQRR